MELLIPGLILVALMVYASTKIKKNAAIAFERESIETEEFSVTKPEGFLHPLNNDSEYAFEAYSKEFGQDHAEQTRQATADLLVFNNSSIQEQRDQISRETTAVMLEKTDGDDIILIEAEREDDDIVLNSFYKLAVSTNKIYKLRISVLPEYKDAYLDRINEMLNSFEVK
ncbi:MAG: hypothetical protein WKF92_15365 [Pyrinomonadaceae bacterium]